MLLIVRRPTLSLSHTSAAECCANPGTPNRDGHTLLVSATTTTGTCRTPAHTAAPQVPILFITPCAVMLSAPTHSNSERWSWLYAEASTASDTFSPVAASAAAMLRPSNIGLDSR